MKYECKQCRAATHWRKAAHLVQDLRKNRVYLCLLIPAIAYVLIFSYTPMVGVIMAFKRYNFAQGLFDSPWVGLNNFKFLVASNKLWPLTRNTLLYNIAFMSSV